jgi:predicted metal-dependent hydrolase
MNIDGNKYEVVIEKRNNKNIYMRVKKDLKIYVSTNRWTSNKYIKKVLTDNYDSIKSMIEKMKNRKDKEEKPMLFGHEIDVVVISNQKHPEIYGNKLYIGDRSKLDTYYKEISYQLFKERLDKLYREFVEGIPYPELKVRKMTSRWGVCNRKNKSITINSELIKKELKYIDYVIVHELCHFIHFNHSSSFWESVSKYCSDYKQLRKEMRE